MALGLFMWVICGFLALPAPEFYAPSQPPAPAERPVTLAPDQVWRLSFHLSGGFVGFDRELQIDSSGRVAATDRRPSRTTSSRATAAELTRVRLLLNKWPASRPLDDGMCRDCLIYEIQLTTDNRSVTIRLNDMNVTASGLAELVETLKQVLARTLEP